MPFCTKYGNEYPDDVSFCPHCGEKAQGAKNESEQAKLSPYQGSVINTGVVNPPITVTNGIDAKVNNNTVAIIIGVLLLVVVGAFGLGLFDDTPSRHNAVDQIRQYVLRDMAHPFLAGFKMELISSVEYVNGYKLSDHEYIVAVRYTTKAKDRPMNEAVTLDRSFRFLKTEKGWIVQNLVR